MISLTGYGKHMLCVPLGVHKCYVCTKFQQSLAESEGALQGGREGLKL